MVNDSNGLPNKSSPALDKSRQAASHFRMMILDVRNRLLADDPAGAATAYAEHRHAHGDWTLEEPDLKALIRALHDRKLWSASIRPMADYLRSFPEQAVRMRFRLAEILLAVERRPGKAIDVLEKLDVGALPADLRETRLKLLAKAEAMKTTCGLEMADGEDW